MLGEMTYLSNHTVSLYKNQHLDNDLMHVLHNLSSQETSIIKMGGSLSYVQQVPWIRNKTIRDNILFGEQLDPERYNRCIEM